MSIFFVSTSTGFTFNKLINLADTYELPAPESITSYAVHFNNYDRENSFALLTGRHGNIAVVGLFIGITNRCVMAFTTLFASYFARTL